MLAAEPPHDLAAHARIAEILERGRAAEPPRPSLACFAREAIDRGSCDGLRLQMLDHSPDTRRCTSVATSSSARIPSDARCMRGRSGIVGDLSIPVLGPEGKSAWRAVVGDLSRASRAPSGTRDKDHGRRRRRRASPTQTARHGRAGA